MWLNMNLDGGINLRFRLKGYKEDRSKGEDWCIVDLNVTAGNTINYKLETDESLMSSEVTQLREVIDSALTGELKEIVRLEPIEPYMAFVVYPVGLEGDGRIEPELQWDIILWESEEAGPSNNCITLFLSAEEMKALKVYLDASGGVMTGDFVRTQEYVNYGVFELEDRDDYITEEQRIEEDAEAGYFYDDDDDLPLTREMVHDGVLPDCISYTEDFFPDGTSYVAELWSEDQVTMVTYFFEREGLENDKKVIEEYLIEMGKLNEGETHHIEVMNMDVKAEYLELYSVTVAVGDDDEIFCKARM